MIVQIKLFLNVNLSIEEDHANTRAKFTFKPETETTYEVISGPGQGIIKNAIVIRGQDILGDKTYKSLVEMNHIPLDLLCYPPPYMYEPEGEKYKDYIFSPGERLGEYQKMLTYFIEQDMVPWKRREKGLKYLTYAANVKKGICNFMVKKRSMILERRYIFGVTTVVQSLAIKEWICKAKPVVEKARKTVSGFGILDTSFKTD